MAVIVAAGMIPFGGTAYAASLFTDDFNDGNADGWSKSGGSWAVAVDGGQVYQQTSTGADAKAQAGQATWTDYTVQARIKPLAYNGANRSVAVLGRLQSTTSYYYLALRSTGVLELGKRVGGGFTSLASAPTGTGTGVWRTVTLRLAGGTLSGSVDGQQLVSANDSSFSAGKIGLSTYYAGASFDDVTVTDNAPPPSPSASGSASVPPSPSSSPLPPGTCNTSGSPTGFAAVNAWGRNGTTGGAGGPTIEVDTAAEFLAAIGQSGPLNICVRGTITLPATPQMHQVTSNKSIIGIGATALITGGGLNIGIPISDAITSPPADAVNNVIIRNLSFRNATDDSINVQMFSHHIWLDHLDMALGYDGLIDIKRGSSYVTVSWVHTHNHSKNMLLGRDDADDVQDTNRLKVSYHHNWFDQTPQRNPRVRYGEPVHIYNNYYFHNTDVGVACQTYAGCMVEGNYFESVEEPISNSYAGPAGRCVARNNIYTGNEPGQPDCSGTVQEPSLYYSYTLDDPASIKALVSAGAGVGKI
ncbi:pectate lyase [Allocatelliglobosispora scoriae]|uniref:Pectate lyase n=2 Tax=Allocatelliglobosispora scoriae TaxID=643052 RepID=A0A841BU48_9ACTN|nr:pectate lyase [Allocatelliglobosispora scoriae]